MDCYVKIESPNTAKRHVDRLMELMGARDLSVDIRGGRSKTSKHVATFMRKLMSMANLMLRLKRGDTLLIQYPFKKFYVTQCRIAHWRGAKTVTLIHDLGTFRRGKLTAEKEIRRLSHTDVIIAHNPSMRTWLEGHGCKVPIVDLDIFDYLAPTRPGDKAQNYSQHHIPTVVFAGGISRRKTNFIYDVDEKIDGIHLDIYGSGLEPDADKHWRNTTFHGSIDSDEFIATIDADWGLVWDGDTVDGCQGTWGSYLRVNNPHKASFYLRASLPVIVWKESAMAPFIINQGVGIAVDSLSQLPQVLTQITPQQYAAYRQAAEKMAGRLGSGHYFYKAYRKALGMIGRE